jgi:hypothetical protein
MTAPCAEPRYDTAIAAIDRLNATDPRMEVDGSGTRRARELVYSDHMIACLAHLYPAASECLRLAARAQHICRWQIARSDYPLGREGYNAWRAACRDHHAALVRRIMQDSGYPEPDIAHVVKLIRKEELKRDAESQALENVVGVVFVTHYLQDFVAGHGDYDEAKLLGILRKTMRKLDGVGHAAIRDISLPAAHKSLVEKSLSSTADASR